MAKAKKTAARKEPPANVGGSARPDGRFFHWEGDVLVLNILGTPSAKLDKIGKPKDKQLKVSVTADPVGGKATDHMVKFLAREFGVRTSDVEVVFGRMSVNKQLRIANPTKFPRAFKLGE